MDVYILSAFALYVLILCGISIFFYRKKMKAESFALGNRSINFWVTAIATQASDVGNWLFLGLPAAIFTGGIFESWGIIGLILFMFLSWHFIAPRFRFKTAELKVATLPDYFESISSDTHKIILYYICSVICLIFFTFYIASDLVGIGRIFSSAFGIPYHVGIIIGLVSGALYTLIGGFEALAWCDTFQGILLLSAIVGVPLYAFTCIDGIAAIQSVLYERNLATSLLTSNYDVFNALVVACSWGLGYFGQPYILANFMAIDDIHKINYAKYVGMAWQLIALSFSVFSGLVCLAFFAHTPVNPEFAFIEMSRILFHPFITGFILCAIIAATMSSLDSQILLSGSVIAENVTRAYNTPVTAQQVIFYSRMGSICISLIGLAIAWSNASSIYFLANYAWSGLGGAFGPAILVTLYAKNISARSLSIGIVSGAVVSLVWPYFNTTMLPLLPAFSVNLGILVMSLIHRKKRFS